MDVRFFETPAEFRAWLEANHETATELWVGFHKKATGRPSITWPEAVDQALCFGWIDGIRKSVGESSYANRFTPRKARSTWSNVNIEKVARLKEQGLMTPAGLRAFEARDEGNSGIYSFEQRPQELPRPTPSGSGRTVRPGRSSRPSRPATGAPRRSGC